MTPVPPDTAAFAARHLRTLEDLQVLMTCIEGRDRWWDAPAVAREVGISATAARHALDNLASGNLLDIRITGDVRYQFNPGTPELHAAALACATAYRTNPVALVQLVAGASKRSVRDFADAFRIRGNSNG
jgi:hypothetical protein